MAKKRPASPRQAVLRHSTTEKQRVAMALAVAMAIGHRTAAKGLKPRPVTSMSVKERKEVTSTALSYLGQVEGGKLALFPGTAALTVKKDCVRTLMWRAWQRLVSTGSVEDGRAANGPAVTKVVPKEKLQACLQALVSGHQSLSQAALEEPFKTTLAEHELSMPRLMARLRELEPSLSKCRAVVPKQRLSDGQRRDRVLHCKAMLLLHTQKPYPANGLTAAEQIVYLDQKILYISPQGKAVYVYVNKVRVGAM